MASGEGRGVQESGRRENANERAEERGSSGGRAAEGDISEKKESCVKHVDALWFCYSPVYQTTQYYREGEFDSCLAKWQDFTDCMLLRTAAAARIRAKREAVDEKEGEGIWSIRSPEEANRLWQEQFGHLMK